MDGQIRRRDAQAVTVVGESLLREPVAVAPTWQRPQIKLVVTCDGVPLADQAAGLRMFAEACRKK